MIFKNKSKSFINLSILNNLDFNQFNLILITRKVKILLQIQDTFSVVVSLPNNVS